MTAMAATFVLAGVAWIVRGAIGSGNPEYWAPVTVIDYAAAGSYTLALLATGVALLLFGNRPGAGRSRVARAGSLLSGAAGGVAGTANFVEDWVGVSAVSGAYVSGIVVFYLAMVATGLALLLRERQLRWIGALLLVPFPALVLGAPLGYALGGIALIACGVLLTRSPESSAARLRTPERAI